MRDGTAARRPAVRAGGALPAALSSPAPRPALTAQARAKTRAAIEAFLDAIERENRGFVLIARDAYREELAR